jgi:hypothetical protein
MHYYITPGMNKAIVGDYPQSKQIANSVLDNSEFLNNIYFKKIDFNPITPIPILNKKAKITDLISNINAGGNRHLIISEKLLNIIKRYRKSGYQTFETHLMTFSGKEINGYFSLNMYASNNEFIDIKNCEVIHYRKTEDYSTTYKTIKDCVKFETYNDFVEELKVARQNYETLYIEKVKLFRHIGEDFFMLREVQGGVGYVASEKLKRDIESAGCTGIEFQSVEFSLNEWLQGGKREEIYGST